MEIDAAVSRVSVRRKQVLDAATACFRKHGFHAASMAQIAAEAEMSVGHIYRYFTNKEALIAGIMRRNLDDAQSAINQVLDEAQAQDLRTALIDCACRSLDKIMHPDKVALMLEVRAESARNAKLAAILHEADAELRAHLRTVLVRALEDDVSAEELDLRVEMLILIMEGLPLRALANPGLTGEALELMMRKGMAGVLKPAG